MTETEIVTETVTKTAPLRDLAALIEAALIDLGAEDSAAAGVHLALQALRERKIGALHEVCAAPADDADRRLRLARKRVSVALTALAAEGAGQSAGQQGARAAAAMTLLSGWLEVESRHSGGDAGAVLDAEARAQDGPWRLPDTAAGSGLDVSPETSGDRAPDTGFDRSPDTGFDRSPDTGFDRSPDTGGETAGADDV